MLAPGARIVLLDNRYIAGSSTPISATDDAGDTWQERQLADGSRHRILKNFPQYEDLLASIAPHARATHWWLLDYFWYFEYQLA